METAIHDLQQERAGIYEQMKKLLDTADADSRELSAEENEKYNKLESDLESINSKIADRERDLKRREELNVMGEEMRRVRNATPEKPQPKHQPQGADDRSLYERYMTAIEDAGNDRAAVLDSIIDGYKKDQRAQDQRLALQQFIKQGFVDSDLRNRAALQMDIDTSGGTMVPPEQFIAQLIKELDRRVFMRSICTVLPLTNADSVGVPTVENDPADADWTAELAIGGTDTTMDTGKRKLHPHPAGKLLRVSKTLLRRSAIGVDALVRDRLGFKFAVTEEKGFMTGSGSNQPLGVFTASAAGISTGQDVSTDNTTTDVTADGLINAKYNLESQYLMSANLRWVFHRDTISRIRKLKDGNGQYLWTPGLSGQPNTILDVPYEMSEYAPSTFTTGLYVGIIGDFSFYWIAESLRFELQRLDELYAATNEVGFIGRLEADGMPVWENAFTRVTLA